MQQVRYRSKRRSGMPVAADRGDEHKNTWIFPFSAVKTVGPHPSSVIDASTFAFQAFQAKLSIDSLIRHASRTEKPRSAR
jgi:hypothetical protein